MINIKITHCDGVSPDESMSRTISFGDKTPFYTEIVPTVFKQPEFLGSMTVWIDTEIPYKRAVRTYIVRPLLVPFRVSNTSLDESTADVIKTMIHRGAYFLNAYGKRFKLSMTVTKSESCSTPSDSTSLDTSESRYKTVVSKVLPLKATAEHGDLRPGAADNSFFAADSGYVPKKVADSL